MRGRQAANHTTSGDTTSSRTNGAGHARADAEPCGGDQNGHDAMRPETLHALRELVALVESRPGLYVRFSAGPERDAAEASVDYESGLELPGLSASSLDPEPWWTRPLEEWLARRLRSYAHLAEADDDRFAWVLCGDRVGEGPDCEPLVARACAVAVLDDQVLEEARQLYHERFDVGRDSRDP